MAGPATVEPESTPTDGLTTIIWCDTLADPNAPTIAELYNGTDLSLYFTEFTSNPSEDTAATPRINTTDTPVGAGRTQLTISTAYVTNPQKPTHDVAATTLTHRKFGYYVVRDGVEVGTAVAIGSKVHVYRVQLGRQTEQRSANQDLIISQTAFVRKDYGVVTAVHS